MAVLAWTKRNQIWLGWKSSVMYCLGWVQLGGGKLSESVRLAKADGDVERAQSSTGTEVSVADGNEPLAWWDEHMQCLFGSRFAWRWGTATVRRTGHRQRGQRASATGTRAEIDAAELVEEGAPVESLTHGWG